MALTELDRKGSLLRGIGSVMAFHGGLGSCSGSYCASRVVDTCMCMLYIDRGGGRRRRRPRALDSDLQLILMLLLQSVSPIATAACCLQEHEDAFGMTLCARGQASKVGETMSSVGAANQPQGGSANLLWGNAISLVRVENSDK